MSMIRDFTQWLWEKHEAGTKATVIVPNPSRPWEQFIDRGALHELMGVNPERIWEARFDRVGEFADYIKQKNSPAVMVRCEDDEDDEDEGDGHVDQCKRASCIVAEYWGDRFSRDQVCLRISPTPIAVAIRELEKGGTIPAMVEKMLRIRNVIPLELIAMLRQYKAKRSTAEGGTIQQGAEVVDRHLEAELQLGESKPPEWQTLQFPMYDPGFDVEDSVIDFRVVLSMNEFPARIALVPPVGSWEKERDRYRDAIIETLRSKGLTVSLGRARTLYDWPGDRDSSSAP